MALEQLPPPAPVPVTDAWEALADGLTVQRIHLHLDELREATGRDAASCGLPIEATPFVLVGRPEPAMSDSESLIAAAGLLPWVHIPQQLGRYDVGTSPLLAFGRQVHGMLTADVPQGPLSHAIEAVCAASAWWVGAFAVLRHRGGHHLNIDDDVTDTVTLDHLTEATHVVALGSASRILRRHLQHTGDTEPALRTAYCRAVTEAIVTEAHMPALLESLSELRLVDLVGNAIPWRGQFLKYRSGLGAGQVE